MLLKRDFNLIPQYLIGNTIKVYNGKLERQLFTNQENYFIEFDH